MIWVINKMKKLYLISAMIMVLVAAAVAASASITYFFSDIQTGQPVNNVDVLVYPCLDLGCNILNLALPIYGSGNSGANSFLTITYPTNLVTPYGYAAYYFAHGYAPQAFNPTWHGTGSATYPITFNKVANCNSDISSMNVNINGNGQVTVSANINSAFTRPMNHPVGYVLPQYVDEYYSSWIHVRFRIYDSSSAVVYEGFQNVNLFRDSVLYVQAGSIALQPGDYAAEIQTSVTDNQCSNSLTQSQNYAFTITGPSSECNDGIDNDGDGLIDFPADLGCTDANDDNETDIIIPPVYECSDGIDNDGDLLIDYPADPGCMNATDDNETNPIIIFPQCNDGIDNDGDGLIDYPADPGCIDLNDDNETDIIIPPVYECSDGIDNDGDFLIDFPADPGCMNATDDNETDIIIPPVYECNDGLDNDGDLLIDFPADPGCMNATDDNETDEVIVCVNHLDISNVYIASTDIPEWVYMGMFTNGIVGMGYIPFDYNFTNSGNLPITNINYTMSMTSDQTGEVTSGTSAIASIAPNTSYIEGDDFNNMITPLIDGLYNMSLSVEGVDSDGCSQYDEFRFYIDFTTLNITFECSDGIDNDGDGLIDINDPGCYDSGSYNPFDDDESDTLPECSDFFDNDGDILIDFPADPGCGNATDDNETDIIIPPVYECNDGVDNDGDLLIDYPADPGCSAPTDDDETDGNQTNDDPVVVLFYPFNGMITNESDIPFMYMVFDDSALWLNCTLYTNISGTWQPEQSLMTLNSFFGLMLEQDIADGTYAWNVMCEDEAGNQGWAPENWTFTITSATPVYQCNDGVDNDGDLLIDYPNDPGCSAPTDDDETDTIVTYPECSDGIDNDGDGLIDFPADPGCTDADDDNETDPVVILPQCSDGIDNDGDGLIDLADPDCQGLGDNNEFPEVVLDPSQRLYIGHIDIHSITNLGFKQELAKAGDEVEVSVYIENLAPYDLEELRMRVYIDELGVWRSLGPFDLMEGDHAVKHVMIDVPEDAAKGDYDVRIVVENQDVKRVKYRVLTII